MDIEQAHSVCTRLFSFMLYNESKQFLYLPGAMLGMSTSVARDTGSTVRQEVPQSRDLLPTWSKRTAEVTTSCQTWSSTPPVLLIPS